MSDLPSTVALPDPWEALRRRTGARIALGRTGSALPTSALLAFELDHARARDAVHRALDVAALAAALGGSIVQVHSAAADRATYLLRPDLGRRLDGDSRARLAATKPANCDVLFVVADGLSALGVQSHAAALIAAVVPKLDGLSIGPVVVAEQGRVALGDEIGELCAARAVVVVIGERPGLTSPDSIGLYLTFAPKRGRHDAERNCISNVRPEGLTPQAAATRLAWLIRASLQLAISGVALKDESAPIEAGSG
ncbi:MAG: ethanolamine ammonia-lyase subunit EutC [Burkholderiaceae bacterium]